IDKELDIRAIISIIKILAVIINVLHKNGYIYCDLKPENIIYDKKEMRIVLIDYGGVVKRGSGVVEFTPTFDRCSWGIGTRLADESYDIFALCMLLVILLNRRVYSPSKQELNNILNKISVSGMGFIRNGLTLKYKNIAEFYKDMESLKYTQNIVKDRKYEKMLNSLLIIAISMFLCIIIAASKKMGF
ncbi:MAG TPA: hypothetical protein GX526_00860, partial [Thermoanaerobacterales bacterium]|nr:hypothetical protein [Thermoanaerobacterales bacterium]